MIALREPHHITEPLVGGHGHGIESQCAFPLCADVRDHAEVVGGTRDEEVITVLLSKFHRALEFRTRRIERPKLEIGDTDHVDGATQRGPVTTPLDHGDRIRKPRSALARRSRAKK